jgi:hypothetical protein
MRSLLLLLLLAPLLRVISPDAATGPPPGDPQVALAPFAVESDSAGILRALADTCLERLARGLTANGIAIARHPRLTDKTLPAARPARWAVLGIVSRKDGAFRAELRLLEVSTGDEMRSYFNTDRDSEPVANLGTAAAARIARFVREQPDS